MVARALRAAAIAAPVSYAVGLAVRGSEAALSAALGVTIVTLNFAVHGWSLAWAARRSVTTLQVVALLGVVVRIGAIVALLVPLDRLTFFSPVAFMVAVAAATALLLVYEARLVSRGIGGQLEIPPSRVAVRAAERLAERGLR
ncbi:MAG: hypothetical protein ACRDH6_09845 [Actinomycetota bacterium]